MITILVRDEEGPKRIIHFSAWRDEALLKRFDKWVGEVGEDQHLEEKAE